MNWKGGKVKVYCKQCGEEKEVYPYKVKTFSFCSNRCKWDSKKGKPVTPPVKKVYITCTLVNCSKGRWVRETKAAESKFCSIKCHQVSISKEYKEYLEKLEREKEEAKKKDMQTKIWGLKNKPWK